MKEYECDNCGEHFFEPVEVGIQIGCPGCRSTVIFPTGHAAISTSKRKKRGKQLSMFGKNIGREGPQGPLQQGEKDAT